MPSQYSSISSSSSSYPSVTVLFMYLSTVNVNSAVLLVFNDNEAVDVSMPPSAQYNLLPGLAK